MNISQSLRRRIRHIEAKKKQKHYGPKMEKFIVGKN